MDFENGLDNRSHNLLRSIFLTNSPWETKKLCITQFGVLKSMFDLFKSVPANISPEDRSALLGQLLSLAESILEENPGNRCCKYLLDYLISDEGKTVSSKGVYLEPVAICNILSPYSYSKTSSTPIPLSSKLLRFGHVLPLYQNGHREPWKWPRLLCYDC